MSELDDIQRRDLDVGPLSQQPHISEGYMALLDRRTLLALVRTQQATLAAVLNLANTSGRCGWRISADELRKTLRGES